MTPRPDAGAGDAAAAVVETAKPQDRDAGDASAFAPPAPDTSMPSTASGPLADVAVIPPAEPEPLAEALTSTAAPTPLADIAVTPPAEPEPLAAAETIEIAAMLDAPAESASPDQAAMQSEASARPRAEPAEQPAEPAPTTPAARPWPRHDAPASQSHEPAQSAERDQPADPLAPLRALSEEETIALFS
jgi:translation initiation factor IF-2